MRTRIINQESARLDIRIADQTPLSRKRVKRLINRGAVRVDGNVVTHPGKIVEAGAVIEVRSAPNTRLVEPSKTGEPNTAQAVVVERYRDPWVLVVDKPTGMPSQPTRQGHQLHLQGLVASQEEYSAMHHRLDTPASGLVLFGLKKEANRSLAEGFRTGTIKRQYRVALVGDPGASGTWDWPIDEKSARSHWKRILHVDGFTVVDVSLETGRTHQIRKHAARAGHPVMGDRRHGGAAGRAWPRLALHAYQITFAHPNTQQPVTVTAPIPPDLQELMLSAPDDQQGDR